MNIFAWFLQILMALHTAMGAGWKFSNSEQSVPSLAAIPHAMWMGLIGLEVICAVGLLLPLINRRLQHLAALGALGIAAEMLLFTGVHLASGDSNHSPLIYWLVVAAICGFIAYARRPQSA